MNRNYAYIQFTGTEDVSIITDLLNLTPSKHWNLGDARSNGTTYNFSRWSYQSATFEKELMDEAILEVVKFVEKNESNFGRIPNCFEFTVQCVGYHEKSISGFHLSRNLLERLYKIKAAVDFDLYCDTES